MIEKLSLIEIYQERVFRSFWFFCQTKIPKFYKDDRKYLKILCDTLQVFYQNKLKNENTICDILIINIPPRHGKSLTLGLFAEWVLGINPLEGIITVSYNEALSTRFAKSVRDGISEKSLNPNDFMYSDLFENVKIKYGDSSKSLWSLEGSYFSYLATSFSGTLTGLGGGLGIIDDPIPNFATANNESALEAQWDFYRNTFRSRIEEGGKQIINHTRWTSRDICGRLLNEDLNGVSTDIPKNIFVLKMQAENEFTGEMLCEEVLSKASNEENKKYLDPAIWQANYQQRTIDSKNRLYSVGFKTYSTELLNSIIAKGGIKKNYTDTADGGGDSLVSINYIVFEDFAFITNIFESTDAMSNDVGEKGTEQSVANFLYNDKVAFARVESNNGGKNFAKHVVKYLRENKNPKTAVCWFHQSLNKVVRIKTEHFFIQQNILFPDGWEYKFPTIYSHIMGFKKAIKQNKHDDIEDVLTGIGEELQGTLPKPKFLGGNSIISSVA